MNIHGSFKTLPVEHHESRFGMQATYNNFAFSPIQVLNYLLIRGLV